MASLGMCTAGRGGGLLVSLLRSQAARLFLQAVLCLRWGFARGALNVVKSLSGGDRLGLVDASELWDAERHLGGEADGPVPRPGLVACLSRCCLQHSLWDHCGIVR